MKKMMTNKLKARNKKSVRKDKPRTEDKGEDLGIDKYYSKIIYLAADFGSDS
jgi:hypothetical protein